MIRPQIDIDSLGITLSEVHDKLIYRLNKKGYGVYCSNHETYGIIAEEFNKELLDALHANDDVQFRSELLDVAVGAIFGIISMDILKDKKEST